MEERDYDLDDGQPTTWEEYQDLYDGDEEPGDYDQFGGQYEDGF